MAADDTARKQRGRPFQKGQSANPAGRPKGARNKLAEDFLADVHALWETDGAAALLEARTEKPTEFVKMVAGLLPKETLVRIAPEEELTDDEIARLLDALRSTALGPSGSDGEAGEGAGPSGRLQ
jgi:hypothetical protein